jgi:uncharacterized protein
MNRDQAIASILKVEPSIRALGAQAVYLFGSTARNEAKPTSDVDIFIDRDPKKPLGFIEFFDLEELLEDTLGALNFTRPYVPKLNEAPFAFCDPLHAPAS